MKKLICKIFGHKYKKRCLSWRNEPVQRNHKWELRPKYYKVCKRCGHEEPVDYFDVIRNKIKF